VSGAGAATVARGNGKARAGDLTAPALGRVCSGRLPKPTRPRSLAMRPSTIALLASLAASAVIAQQPVPEIRFDATVDFLKLPPNVNFGEVAGVAMDAHRHLFVFSRTGTRSTLHGQSSAQLFEFGPDGAFIKEIGKDL